MITGAARGIWEAIARLFYQERERVILTDILEEKGQDLAKELGGNAFFYPLDVKNKNKWKALFEELYRENKGLDILVNNADITGFLKTNGPHDAEGVDMDSWNEVMAINLTGTMLGFKYAFQTMKPKGNGSIIKISS